MMDLLGPVFWLLLSLGVLVTWHEFGHYWVARRCGVRVLCFSVGFGRALWSRQDAAGVEWRLAAIPLGGYVAMLHSEDATPAERSSALDQRPVGQRMWVAAAGPLANLILAIGLLWTMYLVGKPDYAPVIGRATGLALEAGVRPGDRLTAIDGSPVATWSQAGLMIATAGLDRRPVTLELQDESGGRRDIPLNLAQPGLPLRETHILVDAGLLPQHWLLPAVVGDVLPGSPADGRLQPGDRILAIDGEALASFDEISDRLGRGVGDEVVLTVRRDQSMMEVRLRPDWLDSDEGRRPIIGVQPAPRAVPPDTLLRHGPLKAFVAAVDDTGALAWESMRMLWRMVAGQASLSNLSGPVGIAQYADASAERGVAWFLYFLALLSVGIAILNLLPIPVLDGGHLLYYLIELVKGRPLSDRSLQMGQRIGLATLAALVGLALYNDLSRLLAQP